MDDFVKKHVSRGVVQPPPLPSSNSNSNSNVPVNKGGAYKPEPALKSGSVASRAAAFNQKNAEVQAQSSTFRGGKKV